MSKETKMKKINNEFEAKIKVSNFSSKESILDKINSYCKNDKSEEEGENSPYDIEKETANMILLNFKKDTELANYVSKKLKLLQIENSNFSNIKSNLIIKVVNPNVNKGKQNKNENNDNKEKTKTKIISNNIYNIDTIDTKNNRALNKLLSKSLNFNKRNINRYTNPQSDKMKIYESIFLGGPYINKDELIKEENSKNKEKFINKKGFNPYISHETVLKNYHTINNILADEPNLDYQFNFRSVDKSKWVSKYDFNPYS